MRALDHAGPAGAAIARLRAIVRGTLAARGEDPDREPALSNIAYNSTDTRRRAAMLLAHIERGYGFSATGKAVCDLGAGFGGISLHLALEHGAKQVLAVDQAAHHVAALGTIVREFGLDRLTILNADLETFTGYDASVDLVVLSDVLYGSQLSPGRVALVCARLLRPGGIVLFRHVNRDHGPEVASHRDGTQFLDPHSADRAARFLARGEGSTLAHRPLSPAGLAAFLRQAGFGDFRLDGDSDTRYGASRRSQGLRPRYLLSARKIGAPQEFRRIAPPPAGLLDTQTYRDAVSRAGAACRIAAAELCGLFGGALSIATADRELRGYLCDRLLMDGLSAFRIPPQDAAARDFATAIDHALDHALVATLSRAAGWTPANFSQAAPRLLQTLLDGCVAQLRKRFRQPADRNWTESADWDAVATRVAAIVAPGKAVGPRALEGARRRLCAVVADRPRLAAVELLARCADPLTGSAAVEYAEAALDYLDGELHDLVEPAVLGPRPICQSALAALVEEIEAAMARHAGAVR